MNLKAREPRLIAGGNLPADTLAEGNRFLLLTAITAVLVVLFLTSMFGE